MESRERKGGREAGYCSLFAVVKRDECQCFTGVEYRVVEWCDVHEAQYFSLLIIHTIPYMVMQSNHATRDTFLPSIKPSEQS